MLDLLLFFAKLEEICLQIPMWKCCWVFVLFCLFTRLNFPQMEEDEVSKKKEF